MKWKCPYCEGIVEPEEFEKNPVYLIEVKPDLFHCPECKGSWDSSELRYKESLKQAGERERQGLIKFAEEMKKKGKWKD